MKRVASVLLCALALPVAFLSAQGRNTAAPAAASAKPLDIYVVDTEGGKAALWISPTGETLLIDSGNPGTRDIDRLMAAIEDAGVKKIDYLLTTHYHVDHVGGMQELVKRIPVGTFVDHGPTVEGPVNPNLREQVAGFQAWYAETYAKAKHLVVKPGDVVPITGINWRIVSSAGQTLKTALPGAGQANAGCAETQPKEITTDPENGQSVGSLVTFGQFKAIDLADLLWNHEIDLMCPANKIGTVDLYMVSHHGTSPSGSPALLRGLQPRAAVMQNGTRKGGALDAMATMRAVSSLEDIWQLHWSYTAGIEQNSPGVFSANIDDNATIAAALTAPVRGGGPGGQPGGGAPGGRGGAGAPGAPGAPTQAPPAGAPAVPTAPPAGPPAAGAPPAGAPGAAAVPGAPGGGQAGRGGPGGGGGGAAAHTPAYWIKISAKADGTFTITNSRNGFSKTYVRRTR